LLKKVKQKHFLLKKVKEKKFLLKKVKEQNFLCVFSSKKVYTKWQKSGKNISGFLV
jgi:hypothetical protein